MQKVAKNSRAFPFKKYCRPEATAHSHSADAKLPDLTPALTVYIPLSACVLKSPVRRTEFVTTHTHTHTHTYTHTDKKCHYTESIRRE